MSKESLILALAKVLIAAAWADGELDHEEVNSMKDLLWRLPQLSARQWASLQIYLEAPVDESERGRLVQELQNALRSQQDRALTLRTLDEMLHADGQVTDEEERVAAEIRNAIEAVDLSLLSRLVKGMTRRRTEAAANAPNRENYLEDFIQNKVYYGVRRRLALGEGELDLDESALRTLSLAGGMMAQVARVHPDVTDDQVAAMVDALQQYWHLTEEQAAFVAGVAISETATLLDRHRLARRFAEANEHEARVAFLEVLFAVAAADGDLSHEETEEIREISKWLKLSHREFIEAKLKTLRPAPLGGETAHNA
jgi:uncharacterized tellurite resistance protein B-like protein